MESVTDEDVFSAIFDMISDEEVETSKKPKCNARKPHVKAESLWHSAWGQMIGSSDVLDPNSRNGSKFRLRFRVPYPFIAIFWSLSVPGKAKTYFRSIGKVSSQLRLRS